MQLPPEPEPKPRRDADSVEGERRKPFKITCDRDIGTSRLRRRKPPRRRQRQHDQRVRSRLREAHSIKHANPSGSDAKRGVPAEVVETPDTSRPAAVRAREAHFVWCWAEYSAHGGVEARCSCGCASRPQSTLK